ncbi:MAG: hypothetical protein KJ592_00565 [Nanoarchaeota archaeon]|nr:hypothetical protein [Nanoarchaeota archaeon]
MEEVGFNPEELLKEGVADFVWLKENYKELQNKFAGKYVAILNEEVVGCDGDYYGLLELLGSRGIDSGRVLIKRILRPNEILVYNV